MRVQRWLDFERAVREGVRAGRLAGTVSSRQDRKTRKGSAMAILTLSDPSGSYECLAFSEQILDYGEHLEPGSSVIIEVEADSRPDGVSLRLIAAKPIAKAAEKLGRHMTVFLGHENSLPKIQSQLKRGGEGVVSLVVIRDNGAREYEVELPGNFQLTRELAGGIKAAEGVLDVRLN